MSIFIVESTLCLCQLVYRYGSQSALLLCYGTIGKSRHVVEIDYSVAWSGVDDEAVVESGVVGIQLTIHHPCVAIELVDAVDNGSSVGAFAADGIEAEEVSGVVLLERYDNLVLVNRVGGNVASVAADARCP